MDKLLIFYSLSVTIVLFSSSVECTLNFYQINENVVTQTDKIAQKPPYFLEPDQLQTIVEIKTGKSVNFACNSTGSPDPNINWTKNLGQPVQRSALVFTAKGTMHFDNLTLDDAGHYTCTVCNTLGCTNHTTELLVKEKYKRPPFNIVEGYPKNLTIVHGEAAIFECPSKPTREANKFTWSRVRASDGYVFNTITEGLQDNGAKLVITKVFPDDEGWFTCTVKSKTKAFSSASAYLHVVHSHDQTVISSDTALAQVSGVEDIKTIAPIHLIDVGPENQTALENSTVLFACGLHSSFKNSTLFWTTLNNMDGKLHNVTIDTEWSKSGQSLRLKHVSKKDEGWYICTVKTPDGLKQTAQGYLSIKTLKTSADDDSPQSLTLSYTFRYIIAGGLLSAIVVVIILDRQLRRKHWMKKVIVEQPKNDETDDGLIIPLVHIELDKSAHWMKKSSNYEFKADPNWEFPRKDLHMGAILGEGAFGKVVMAEANGLFTTGVRTVVAVKMLKNDYTDADVTDLVCEMEVMKLIGKHENIVNLLGCCCQSGELLVLVEFALHGNLQSFLKKNRKVDDSNFTRTLNHQDLLIYARQIAEGMKYLASKKCIHRDLAARNVLVSGDFTMKISDFGLARDITGQDYYRKRSDGLIPFKWMAPESVTDNIYSSASDVWSYGVLLWEIMTFGITPYPTIENKDLYEHLRRGYRMKRPSYCPEAVYTLMQQCWKDEPTDRPTFVDIAENLEKISDKINTEPNDEQTLFSHCNESFVTSSTNNAYVMLDV